MTVTASSNLAALAAGDFAAGGAGQIKGGQIYFYFLDPEHDGVRHDLIGLHLLLGFIGFQGSVNYGQVPGFLGGNDPEGLAGF